MSTKRPFLLLMTCFLVLVVMPALSVGQQAKQITPSDTTRDLGQRELQAAPKIQAQLKSLRSNAKEKGWTFKVGYTTALDFKLESITGLKVPDNLNDRMKKQDAVAADCRCAPSMAAALGSCSPTAKEFDWRDHGGTTDPRDQGGCGSCWAFATHGAYEGSYAILSNQLENTSEQDTLDCSGAGSCAGGWWAFDYLIATGAAEEADYSYTAVQGTCKSSVDRPYKALAWGYVDSSQPIPKVAALKTALCQYGPLAVAVRATSAFQAYTSGVFNENDSGNVNHGVTLIGWDDSKKAWLIKNSWGTGWGMSGHMWIAFDSNSIGYAAAWCQAKAVEPPPKCKDRGQLASSQFYFTAKKQFHANSNVMSVTFALPQEMYVHITAESSARLIKGKSPRSFTTGLHSAKSPNIMWTGSLRKGSFLTERQYVPVQTSYVVKLPQGKHTIFWKLWIGGYVMQFDSGVLAVSAFPCNMGVKAMSTAEVGAEEDEVTMLKDGVLVTMNGSLLGNLKDVTIVPRE